MNKATALAYKKKHCNTRMALRRFRVKKPSVIQKTKTAKNRYTSVLFSHVYVPFPPKTKWVMPKQKLRHRLCFSTVHSTAKKKEIPITNEKVPSVLVLPFTARELTTNESQ